MDDTIPIYTYTLDYIILNYSWLTFTCLAGHTHPAPPSSPLPRAMLGYLLWLSAQALAAEVPRVAVVGHVASTGFGCAFVSRGYHLVSQHSWLENGPLKLGDLPFQIVI